MKTFSRIASILVFAAIVAQTSCSVQYRTRHPRRHHVVIRPTGMIQKTTPVDQQDMYPYLALAK